MLNNHLMVTKDNDKKIKIKQDFIKESESFLILDENGYIYNKNKNNYMQLTKLLVHQLYNILYKNNN